MGFKKHNVQLPPEKNETKNDWGSRNEKSKT